MYDRTYYLKIRYREKSLLEWAIIWFRMTNDSFYKIYGFNFNPHDYTNLYIIARKEVYGQ